MSSVHAHCSGILAKLAELQLQFATYTKSSLDLLIYVYLYRCRTRMRHIAYTRDRSINRSRAAERAMSAAVAYEGFFVRGGGWIMPLLMMLGHALLAI